MKLQILLTVILVLAAGGLASKGLSALFSSSSRKAQVVGCLLLASGCAYAVMKL